MNKLNFENFRISLIYDDHGSNFSKIAVYVNWWSLDPGVGITLKNNGHMEKDSFESLLNLLMTRPYILICIFVVVNKNRFESGRDQVAIRKKANLEIEESLELDRITSLNEINSSIIIETPIITLLLIFQLIIH